MPPKGSGTKRPISSGGGGPSTKKARFTDEAPQARVVPRSAPDAEESYNDEGLEDLDAPSSARRGKVKTEGYDSDSSDDGEGVVESRKKSLRKKKKGGGDDDDDDDMDMFGGNDDKEDSETEGNTKKKKIKFMNLGDIEGQEFGQDGTDDDDDEPEDQDDAARRAKKGMGYDISSFNMKDEMDEGKFDEDGTFVRSFDPHQVHDKWMEGMDEREIKKARRSQKKIKEKEEERLRKEQEDGLVNKRKEELEQQLLDYVRPGESVLQTLSRLGAEKKKVEKGKPKTKSRSAKSSASAPAQMDVDPGRTDPGQHPENSAIERVTSLASTLMAMGELHVYEETHRTLLHSIKEAGLVPQDWVPPSAVPPPPPPESLIKYQYRWSPEYLATTSGGAKADEVFGPYRKDELTAWRDALYFGPDGGRIQLRKLGEEAWSDWQVVV